MARTLTTLAALVLVTTAVSCRAIVGVDDKYLVDDDAGGGGCGGATGAVDCPPSTSSSVSSTSTGDMATESPATPPALVNIIGCADGTREGFFDRFAYPTIAACSATWTAQSMRSPPTGTPCGDDLPDSCGSPADACATGWHVCLSHGYPGDLTSRISADDCWPLTTALTSSFLAAASQNGGIACGDPLPCNPPDGGWCIAVCCGQSCFADASSCVFHDEKTPFGGGPCAEAHAEAPDGVLCCMDPEIMF